MKSKSERPLGISIVGILHIIMGLFTMLAQSGALRAMPVPEKIGIGIFMICLGIGLLWLHPWALPATIASYGLAIIGSMSQPHLSTIIFALAIVAYLCTPGARRAFLPCSVPSAPATTLNS